MNRRSKEGAFYASKVHLFFNEYGELIWKSSVKQCEWIILKCAIVWDVPSYRKPSAVSKKQEVMEESINILFNIELQPLVVDAYQKM